MTQKELDDLFCFRNTLNNVIKLIEEGNGHYVNLGQLQALKNGSKLVEKAEEELKENKGENK
jgi:hypothetical protein